MSGVAEYLDVIYEIAVWHKCLSIIIAAPEVDAARGKILAKITNKSLKFAIRRENFPKRPPVAKLVRMGTAM